MEKFKANDNKNEEHEINYRQFNKKLELLNQILSLISDINQASDEKVIDTIRFYCTARWKTVGRKHNEENSMKINGTAAKHIKKYCYIVGLLSFLLAFFVCSQMIRYQEKEKKQWELIWHKAR